MNSNQQREIVEDTPQYRSVMMRPLPAPPLPRSFARPVMKVAPQLKRPTISAASSRWSLSELPSLPAAYFLERTNVHIDGNSQEIASRISDCLRIESIAATFDEEDKNLLRAETNDCVTFVVRLFADKGMVVVEVQRTSGCSFQFREAARSVLKSAKGVQCQSPPKRNFTIPSFIPTESMEQKEKRTEDGLETAFGMLQSSRSDTQLLALESLEQITRTCECRSKAAKYVLAGDCLKKVLSCATSSTEAQSDMEERHHLVMKRRSLALLANSLGALSESGELESVLGSNVELRSQSLVASLVSTLEECSSQPHEACHSARCIEYLLKANKEVERFLVETSAISAAATACTIGACRSNTLEKQSRRLIVQLSHCA